MESSSRSTPTVDHPSSVVNTGMTETAAPTQGASWQPVEPAEVPVRGKRGSKVAQQLIFNVVLPVLLLAAGVLVVMALGKVEPAPRPVEGNGLAARMGRLTSVSVMPIYSLDDLGADLELTVDGEVVPFREVTIATEVAGRIIYKSQDCETGSVVKKGTVLMRIDPTDYELELERLTRAKEQAYQSVREAEQEIRNTQRLIEVAKRDITLKERELNRQKSLPKGFSTAGDLDRAEGAVLQANQQLVSYQNQLDTQQQRQASQDAALRVAETQLKTAEVNLQRTEVIAPIDGVIVREDAEMNTFVARGNPIVTMEDTSKVEVASSLRMDQLYWVRLQHDLKDADSQKGYKLPETPATIEFEVSGRDDMVYRWEGRLVGYDGIGLDSRTRTVPVRILVDRPRQFIDQDGLPHESTDTTALVRGMFVKVGLRIKPDKKLIAVPEKAIKPGNRIWQFRKDETVLEDPSVRVETEGNPASDRVEKDSASTDSASTESADASEEKNTAIDPDRWDAGRVQIVEPIVPVNLLRQRFVPEEAFMMAGDESADATTNWWVCELPDDVTTTGSYVVVSPLGTIPEEGLPARILKPESL